MNYWSVPLGFFAAGGAASAALAWVSVSPANGFWGRVHSRAPAGGARAAASGVANAYALTFDDGPTRDSTTAVLDLLGELAVPAAFFVVGVNARRCPDLLGRMHREGHLVANHSLSHDHLGMFGGRPYWERELGETDEIIRQASGLRPAMFRPPMGIKTGFNMAAARRRRQEVITWSRRGMDGVRTTPARILERLAPNVVAGDIVVLHDGVEPHVQRDPAATVAAVRPLVLRLRDRGLEPGRLDALLGLRAYHPEEPARVGH